VRIFFELSPLRTGFLCEELEVFLILTFVKLVPSIFSDVASERGDPCYDRNSLSRDIMLQLL